MKGSTNYNHGINISCSNLLCAAKGSCLTLQCTLITSLFFLIYIKSSQSKTKSIRKVQLTLPSARFPIKSSNSCKIYIKTYLEARTINSHKMWSLHFALWILSLHSQNKDETCNLFIHESIHTLDNYLSYGQNIARNFIFSEKLLYEYMYIQTVLSLTLGCCRKTSVWVSNATSFYLNS